MGEYPADFDELLQRAFRYALSLTNDRHLAEDLLQDACLSISRRGGPWRISYLITVIRNRYIDLYRRHQTVIFRPLDETDGAIEDWVDRDCSQVSVHLDGALEEALATLRVEEREMLYLSAVEDYSASQIAQLTARPRGTVLSVIHRAKKKLRHMLTQYTAGETDERYV
ncbi:MAG: RNA polymerase sigma factor [Chloroflexota bacterium]